MRPSDKLRQLITRQVANSGAHVVMRWARKRKACSERRHHLLAYAMLRRRPYREVEPHCQRPPSEHDIQKALRAVVPDHDMVRWPRERIESWIAGRLPCPAPT